MKGDTISRAAAIDALNDIASELHERKRLEEEYIASWCADTIESLPSTPQWIPCSERLPEDEQPILFSTTTGRVHQGRFHMDNSINRWYSSLDKMRAYNNVVNAWMPLPEPYQEVAGKLNPDDDIH